MKKKYLIITIYFFYVALLFIVARNYDYKDEHFIPKDLNDLSDSLKLFFQFLAIAFISSAVFLIIAFIIYDKVSRLFILLAPFVNVAMAAVVGLIMNFIFWITQLEEVLSDFQKVFVISTISTMGTFLWLGDVLKKEIINNGMK
jgi:type III secretory pathway component EscS